MRGKKAGIENSFLKGCKLSHYKCDMSLLFSCEQVLLAAAVCNKTGKGTV